jgi:hypothetical protein
MALCGRRIYLMTCFCLLLNVLCFEVTAQQAESSAAANQKTIWKTILSFNDWLDMWPAVMKVRDGFLVSGLSHHKTDNNEFDYKVVLWKIDLQGKELWVKDINLTAWQTQKSFVPERFFSLQDEPTLLLVSASTIKAWLLQFDDAGSIVFSKEFAPKQVFDIQGFRKTNGGFLLYGSRHKGGQDSDACVEKLDQDGNEIWSREYDKGKMEWGMGLTVQKDGGFILSADSGIYNKFGGGPSNAWIIKCDPNGNILGETTFSGRHPSVILNGDVVAVVFNKENFPQQDISVTGFDINLKTIWHIDSLFGKVGGLGMLRTIVDKQGNFVLAGNKFNAAALWEVSKDGKILKEVEIKDANFCPEFESLLQTPTGYLVAGHSPTMSKIPIAADGKIIKDAQWDDMDILVIEVADSAK